MKTKSFAMLAMTGLAVSCLYISPAMADETNIGGTQAAPADQISSPSDVNATSSASNDTMNVDNSNVTTNNTDQGSPDTATGDDDY